MIFVLLDLGPVSTAETLLGGVTSSLALLAFALPLNVRRSSAHVISSDHSSTSR